MSQADLSSQLSSIWSASNIDPNIRGINRADELAGILSHFGITDLSQLGLKSTQTEMPGEWVTAFQNDNEIQQWIDPYTKTDYQLTYGDRVFGDLGGVASGGEKQYLTTAPQQYIHNLGNNTFRIAGSAAGKGAVDYIARFTPEGRLQSIAPQWQSSSDWPDIRNALLTVGGLMLGGMGLENLLTAGTAAGAGGAGAAGAGGLEAALADAALAAASGTTPEALAAWASGAGVGTGELAALGGLGAGGAGAAGAGIGGLEAALADAAAAAASGTTPEALAAWGKAAGIGTGELAALGGVPSWLANAGTTALNAFQKNPLGMISAGASLLGGDSLGGGGAGGGGANIPINMALRAQRERLPQPEYRPYSGEAVMGRQYFTPVSYSNQAAAPVNPVTPEPVMDVGPAKEGDGNAAGGLLELARGGRALPPRYLRGETDGMADKIPSSIDGQQPAKLSHGEFVIPADVVSHLGNGNSDAGAKVLYKMMDRVRQARTGNKKQGKQIKPEKFMPGGIAGYNSGGAVAFQAGGPALPGTGDLGMTQSSTLSSWAAPYVTNLLSQGQALGSMPYQAYTGPLTAGVSPLQQTAFSNAQNLGGTFDANAAQQYMNPYIQTALNPQLDLLRRQADISLQGDLSKYTQAGAFGGSRSAIAQGLNRENLGQQMERVTGQAYQSAFDKAMQQFNTQQNQNIANVQAQASLGGQQRDIEQQGIAAMQKQFEQERDYPYQQLSFQQNLLKGLPISTQTTSPLTSGLGSILGDVAGAASIYKLIGDLFPG